MRQIAPSHSPAARHYHPTLSIWLSVDPLADKYPGVSPYTYCGNNPVRLVDPDGREIGDYYNWQGKRLGWDGQKDTINKPVLTELHGLCITSTHFRA